MNEDNDYEDSVKIFKEFLSQVMSNVTIANLTEGHILWDVENFKDRYSPTPPAKEIQPPTEEHRRLKL